MLVTALCRRGASLAFIRAAATSSHQQTSVTDALQRRVQQGALRPDHDQLRAASVLDRLLTVAEAQRARVVSAAAIKKQQQEVPSALQRGSEPGPEEPGNKDSAQSVVVDDHHVKQPELPAICGAYLWGSVGTGKTMMMDKFATELRSHGIPVRRSHFHDFMLDVHAKLHDFHKAIPVVTVQSLKGELVHRQVVQPDEDPIEAVAEVVRRTEEGEPAQFLCFDELHVADVADAMILSRLFRQIISKGTLVMFTSNQHPSSLYKGGLSRDYFLPFIDLVVSRTVVLQFGGALDYRREPKMLLSGSADGPSEQQGQWLSGAGSAAQEELLWRLECGANESSDDFMLPVRFGRMLRIPESVRAPDSSSMAAEPAAAAAAAAARFSFEDLCGSRGLSAGRGEGGALGPNDYTALSRAFPALHVTSVPALTSANRDEARRWVVLLDCLYESRTRLVCQADCSPEEMFLGIRSEAQAVLDASAGESPSPDAKEELPSRRGDSATPEQLVAESIAGDVEREWGRRQQGSKKNSNEFESSPAGLVKEELLMYQRAESRLAEMCGAAE